MLHTITGFIIQMIPFIPAFVAFGYILWREKSIYALELEKSVLEDRYERLKEAYYEVQERENRVIERHEKWVVWARENLVRKDESKYYDRTLEEHRIKAG